MTRDLNRVLTGIAVGSTEDGDKCFVEDFPIPLRRRGCIETGEVDGVSRERGTA